MKKIILILVVTLLHGCVLVNDEWAYVVRYPNVVLEGDSKPCKVWNTDKEIKHIKEHDDELKTYPRLVGIVDVCRGGKTVMDVDHLPTGYDITFIALGDNDVIRGIPIEDFFNKYVDLYTNSDSKYIYCILPDAVVMGKDGEPYRNAIRSICANVIDPADYGLVGLADGTHYVEHEHRIATRMITDVLKKHGLM